MLLSAPLCAAPYLQVSSAKEKKGPRAKERKEAVKLVPSFKVRHTHCVPSVSWKGRIQCQGCAVSLSLRKITAEGKTC